MDDSVGNELDDGFKNARMHGSDKTESHLEEQNRKDDEDLNDNARMHGSDGSEVHLEVQNRKDDDNSNDNARVQELIGNVERLKIPEKGGRTKCPNCSSKKHFTYDTCTFDFCWKCLKKIIKGVNGPMNHDCKPRKCLHGSFDRGYLYFVEFMKNNPKSNGMPEGAYELAERFNSIIYQNKTSITDIQIEAQQSDRVPNALVAPMWMGAYNAQTLREIAKLFYDGKISGLGKIKFVPNQMRARKVNIGKDLFWTELLFDLDVENSELKGLLFNLEGDSLLTVSYADGQIEESEVRLRIDGRNLIVRMRGISFLKYDQQVPGNALLQRHCSLQFDFGGAPIKKQIEFIDLLITMDSRLIRPKCIVEHLNDFNAPMQEEIADHMRESGMDKQELDKKLNELLKAIDPDIVLEDSQRNSVLAALRLEMSGIKGPPGCGKTFVMALVVLAQACILKRTCLILTSRNHTADDIVNKVVELVKKMKINARKHYGIDDLKDFVVRSFPKRRLDSAMKGVSNGFASKEDKDGYYSKFRIVVSTVGHAYCKSICQFESDFLCIDEVGLLNPVEFYSILGARLVPPIPLDENGRILTSGKRMNFDQLLVVGDFTQMRSRFSNYKVFSDKLTFDTGMDISILERIVRNQTKDHQLVHVLNKCRRGPAPIHKPVFDIWYKDEKVEFDETLMSNFVQIREGESKPTSCLNSVQENLPMNSIYVEGPAFTDSNVGGSRKNKTFLDISKDIIIDLIEKCSHADGSPIKPEEITYCTFYREQYHEMQAWIKRQNLDIKNVHVHTVDQMQGLQNKIVILDAVRSGKNLGFLDGQTINKYGSPHNGRLVVALSRAIELRIVISNATYMPDGCDLRKFQKNQKEASKFCSRTRYIVFEN